MRKATGAVTEDSLQQWAARPLGEIGVLVDAPDRSAARVRDKKVAAVIKRQAVPQAGATREVPLGTPEAGISQTPCDYYPLVTANIPPTRRAVNAR